jgi:hypothetical protein
LILKTATIAIAFMNPVSHFSSVRRNVTHGKKKLRRRKAVGSVSALQKSSWLTHTFHSRSFRKAGLEFKTLPCDGTPIVCIGAISPGTEAAGVPELAVGLILTAIGETHVEGMELAGILQMIHATRTPSEGELQLSFRRARVATTGEPCAEVRTPAQQQQEANGGPIEPDVINVTPDVSGDPVATIGRNLLQEQIVRDKLHRDDAMSVTASASDESDIDVTVDSCGNQDVEVKSAGKDEQALAAQNVPKATMESNEHQKHGNGEDKEVLAMRSYKAWQDHDATGSNTKESKSQSAERHTRSTVAEGVRCLPRLGLVLCLHCMMGVMLT